MDLIHVRPSESIRVKEREKNGTPTLQGSARAASRTASA